jgi:DNA-binding MarR family transcriptional regulator
MYPCVNAGSLTGRPIAEADLAEAGRIGDSMVQMKRLMTSAALQMSATGLEWSSFGLLAYLVAHGPHRASALAEAMFTDPSNVSRQIARLVKEGHIERQSDPADGRVSVLVATESGQGFVASRMRGRNSGIAHVVADWPEEDRQHFAELFERYIADYERWLPTLTACYIEAIHTEGNNND